VFFLLVSKGISCDGNCITSLSKQEFYCSQLEIWDTYWPMNGNITHSLGSCLSLTSFLPLLFPHSFTSHSSSSSLQCILTVLNLRSHLELSYVQYPYLDDSASIKNLVALFVLHGGILFCLEEGSISKLARRKWEGRCRKETDSVNASMVEFFLSCSDCPECKCLFSCWQKKGDFALVHPLPLIVKTYYFPFLCCTEKT